MAGIYIHIPFCKQACFYCNFHFSTSQGSRKEMADCLIKEINLRRKGLEENIRNDIVVLTSPDEKIETIYFGGGTPSLLSDNEIFSIIDAIKNNYYVAGNAEITLEANPDDINSDKLKEWKIAGVNRLSIGIQSFIERDLVWMNR
ncbi:MAG: radical SAM protein, partial [Ginsengibacter sp.]